MSLRLLLFLTSFFSLLWADAHILVYHRFGDNRYPTTNTSLKELKREFEYLKRHNYQVVPLSWVVEKLHNGEKVPNNWVVITIDDGFKSFLKALPLFKKYNYPFTLLISTKPTNLRYPDFLTWRDLKRVSKFGEIGFHSHSHPHLLNLSKKEIIKDTKTGLELFKKHLGFFPKYYAYPYGEYNLEVEKILKEFNFTAILNQDRGAVGDNPFRLNRLAMVGKSNLKAALRVNHLKANWIKPQRYFKILKEVEVEIDPKYKKAFLYVTGYGWRRVKVRNGKVKVKLGYKLKRARTRVILKVKNSKISTKLIVRSKRWN
ncbi:MAG: polysaccharide deacetylase family protein [Epsilonproteobacteria bacterium]|nr:polysaccharide deacetylase family protein [Campylobacterota bacterium]